MRFRANFFRQTRKISPLILLVIYSSLGEGSDRSKSFPLTLFPQFLRIFLTFFSIFSDFSSKGVAEMWFQTMIQSTRGENNSKKIFVTCFKEILNI